MMYLLLSILSSTIIFIVFKLYDTYKVNTFQAIVVNYLVAGLCGVIAYKGTVTVSQIPSQPWFLYTLGLGALFIIVFNLMALTTQLSGLSVVSVATKMSVVIPIVFGLWYYNETLDIFKSAGILLALVAVYLASVKNEKGFTIKPKNLLLPILVFLGSGVIDTSIKFLEEAFIAQADVPIFSATIFSAAFTIGLLLLCYKVIILNQPVAAKNIVGGIALGIPNYFSIYFLVQSLRSGILESSGIFTVNNVGIVALSTMIGILLFKEKLLLKNWIGIILAVISIVLVAVAKIF